MKRGDLWYVDLGGRAGKRPVLILTRQAVLQYLNKVTVAEITSRGKGYPTEVYIGKEGNLQMPSFVQTDNIHTIPKHKLIKHSGTLTKKTMKTISRKIVLALELEDVSIF